MNEIDLLPRHWWSFDLPGYREGQRPATYRAVTELPPIERTLDERLQWLRQESRVAASLADIHSDRHPRPTRIAGPDGLRELIGGRRIPLPATFSTFVSDPDLQARVRSGTSSYLDLGDLVAEGRDGRFIHFLTDQQWVAHWSLYVGTDGRERVIVTDQPLGFRDEDRVHDSLDLLYGHAAICADSFAEFLYRYWIENEIIFRVADRTGGEPELTPEQRRYAEFFRR